jgi:hypothetical protein
MLTGSTPFEWNDPANSRMLLGAASIWIKSVAALENFAKGGEGGRPVFDQGFDFDVPKFALSHDAFHGRRLTQPGVFSKTQTTDTHDDQRDGK